MLRSQQLTAVGPSAQAVQQVLKEHGVEARTEAYKVYACVWYFFFMDGFSICMHIREGSGDFLFVYAHITMLTVLRVVFCCRH